MAQDELRAARERALALGCAPLVDAMGRTHTHPAHLPAWQSPTPDVPLAGPAVTIGFLPTRDDLPGADRGFAEVLAEAAQDAPDGAVLVLSSGGHPGVSHAGGTKLARVPAHGLAGVLCDGLLRDFTELAALGLPTWCRGEAVRWGGDSVMPYVANVAVEVAGVTVAPGDFVYVDRAGGVVVPAASLGAVLDEAETVVADDARTVARIRGGVSR